MIKHEIMRDKIENIVRNTTDFHAIGKEFEKIELEYSFTFAPIAHYAVEIENIKYIITNKNNVDIGDYDVVIGKYVIVAEDIS